VYGFFPKFSAPSEASLFKRKSNFGLSLGNVGAPAGHLLILGEIPPSPPAQGDI